MTGTNLDRYLIRLLLASCVRLPVLELDVDPGGGEGSDPDVVSSSSGWESGDASRRSDHVARRLAPLTRA
jgi:hypothetical protein